MPRPHLGGLGSPGGSSEGVGAQRVSGGLKGWGSKPRKRGGPEGLGARRVGPNISRRAVVGGRSGRRHQGSSPQGFQKKPQGPQHRPMQGSQKMIQWSQKKRIQGSQKMPWGRNKPGGVPKNDQPSRRLSYSLSYSLSLLLSLSLAPSLSLSPLLSLSLSYTLSANVNLSSLVSGSRETCVAGQQKREPASPTEHETCSSLTQKA